MSSRDYKNKRPRKESNIQTKLGSWFSFFTGLSTGLVVAFGVYLWASDIPSPMEIIGNIGASLGREESTHINHVSEK